MKDLQGWIIESTIRLGKLTLIFLKNNEPRGSLVFEDDEEEEAATWVELIYNAQNASGNQRS